MIASVKPVRARSMVMFKTSHLRFQIVIGRRSSQQSCVVAPPQLCMIVGHAVARLVVHWSCHLAIGGATRRTKSRSVVRLLTTCPDWLHELTTGGTTNILLPEARRCGYVSEVQITTTPEESILL